MTPIISICLTPVLIIIIVLSTTYVLVRRLFYVCTLYFGRCILTVLLQQHRGSTGYYSYGDKVHGDMVTSRVWNYGYGPYGTMVTAFSQYGTMVTANLAVTILPCLKIDCHHKAVLKIGCHHSSMKNAKCHMSPHVHSIMVTATDHAISIIQCHGRNMVTRNPCPVY